MTTRATALLLLSALIQGCTLYVPQPERAAFHPQGVVAYTSCEWPCCTDDFDSGVSSDNVDYEACKASVDP